MKDSKSFINEAIANTAASFTEEELHKDFKEADSISGQEKKDMIVKYGVTTKRPSTPASTAATDNSIAVCVELDPVPATTGILPFVNSTAFLIHSTCSASDNVADSPVVPHIIILSVPLLQWKSINSSNLL